MHGPLEADPPTLTATVVAPTRVIGDIEEATTIRAWSLLLDPVALTITDTVPSALVAAQSMGDAELRLSAQQLAL